jgi:hypothetical protein
MLQIDIGFTPSRLLTLDVTLPKAPADRHNAFYTALLARVRALPGVDAVGAVYQRPLEHAGIGMDATILLEGQRTELQFRGWEQNPLVNLESVTPDYFRAIGLAVGRGRAFTEADTELTLAMMAMLFIVVGGVALIVPAWRAARVDAALALRYE